MGQVYDPDAGLAHPLAAYRGSFVYDIAEETTNITPVIDPIAPVDTSDQGGDLLLLWSFTGQTCAEAEVSQVTLILDRRGTQLIDGGFIVAGQASPSPCPATPMAWMARGSSGWPRTSTPPRSRRPGRPTAPSAAMSPPRRAT